MSEKTLISQIEQALRNSWDAKQNRPRMKYYKAGPLDRANVIRVMCSRVCKREGWEYQTVLDDKAVSVRRLS